MGTANERPPSAFSILASAFSISASHPSRCRSAGVGKIRRSPSFDRHPSDARRGVDVEDLHRALAPVQEAVGDARRDEGGLVRTKLKELALDLAGCLALDHRDRLLAVVGVKDEAGARIDRRDAGQQARRADLAPDEVERFDARIRLPGMRVFVTDYWHGGTILEVGHNGFGSTLTNASSRSYETALGSPVIFSGHRCPSKGHRRDQDSPRTRSPGGPALRSPATSSSSPAPQFPAGP